MRIEQTGLPGVLILQPKIFTDSRGCFSESWSRRTLAESGIEMDFVQDNFSLSKEVGTVRGLHCQAPPHAQSKLVRCGWGRLYDVAVDVRDGSPTFGQWIGVELSADNGKQLLIPTGFLHGFVTREANTVIVYKCSNYYSPNCEMSVRFDDPEIGIEWGMDTPNAILAEKDFAAPVLADFNTPFTF